MRFVETLSAGVNDRLTASTKKELHQKVASSDKPQHKGYPDETGFVPSIVVDPSHSSKLNEYDNICYNEDMDKTTVYTASLAFPHIPVEKHVQTGFSIQKLTSFACVDANEVFGDMTEDTQSVLRERERLRMKAVKSDHSYNLNEDKVLTANSEEKILINAYRTAKTRVEGEPTVSDVQDVIHFKRNKFDRYLSFDMNSVSNEMLQQMISTKTCSPIIPANENHKTVLLYWMDNPDASISEVIEQTGISRGKFETFRLNLPDVSCYNRSYIESLSFDEDSLVNELKEYMGSSPHDIYDCSICDKWSYSKMSLSAHKKNSDDHTENKVTESEIPQKKESESESVINWDNMSVSDMLESYSESQDATKPDQKSLAELLCESEMLSLNVICESLNENEVDILRRITDSLTDSEKEKVKSKLLQ